MKEKLLLVGAGGLGRVVSEHAGKIYDCAFLDDGKPSGTIVCGVPVIGTVKDLEKFYPEYDKLVVTIGNNPLRERIYQEAARVGYAFPNIILSSVYVSPYAQIGQGCIFLNNAVQVMSSTEIRQQLRKGEPCEALLPAVAEYIKTHDLYKGESQ